MTFQRVLLYVVFIVMPLGIMTQCNKKFIKKLVGVIDVNKNGLIDNNDVQNFVEAFDRNYDGVVLPADINDQLRDLYPSLAGRENDVFNILDDTNDGKIENKLFDGIIVRADTNKDGYTTVNELVAHLKCTGYNTY